MSSQPPDSRIGRHRRGPLPCGDPKEQKMNIAILGAPGNLGSTLVQVALALGHRVTARRPWWWPRVTPPRGKFRPRSSMRRSPPPRVTPNSRAGCGLSGALPCWMGFLGGRRSIGMPVVPAMYRTLEIHWNRARASKLEWFVVPAPSLRRGHGVPHWPGIKPAPMAQQTGMNILVGGDGVIGTPGGTPGAKPTANPGPPNLRPIPPGRSPPPG